jgi:dTDP-4-dehydrorhamnose reductase
MKILVTGGLGRVGAAVLARLTRAGHELLVIGRSARPERPGMRYAQCDITRMDQLAPALQGMDAVVHLAAIPGPGGQALEEIFRVNCCGTFNVFEAAARAGIRRVVAASSINAFGFNFGIKPFPIASLPIDERSPSFTTDGYSFSKQVTERIAEYAFRRDSITSVCLRVPWVCPSSVNDREPVLKHAAECRAVLEALDALSESARRERIAGWIAVRDQLRRERGTEHADPSRPYREPNLLVSGRTDFWTRIDERDCAQAVERALCAEIEGSFTVFANDSHNIAGVASSVLARLFFPEAATREQDMPGTESLVSIRQARELLGFEPEFSVGRWFG